MKKTKKGNEFKGLAGGGNYVRFARWFGIDEKFYREAVGNLPVGNNQKALDLGCGPGAASYALAEKAPDSFHITGIDISESQLAYARSKADGFKCRLDFLNMSMDELHFPDNHFDWVISSMALHETPMQVRRATIKEVYRVLKPGGMFVYTDWSCPRFGLWGIVWFPLICRDKRNKDNRRNEYLRLCEDSHLYRIEDGYINSIARRQVFKK